MAKKNDKIGISLTDFVDFVSKSGGAKLTHVRQIKNRAKYSPATDFYKALREGIIEIHQNAGKKTDLQTILSAITDKKKTNHYSSAVDGYKKFWGNKDIEWFEPPHKHWTLGEIDVRINPELGLEYNGKFYVIKMYLKSQKLTRDKITQILCLLEDQLRKKSEPEIVFALLDVRNNKIFLNSEKDKSLMPLLKGEASNFEIIWQNI